MCGRTVSIVRNYQGGQKGGLIIVMVSVETCFYKDTYSFAQQACTCFLLNTNTCGARYVQQVGTYAVPYVDRRRRRRILIYIYIYTYIVLLLTGYYYVCIYCNYIVLFFITITCYYYSWAGPGPGPRKMIINSNMVIIIICNNDIHIYDKR